MADNSEEFDFAAASKAEIDKAKEDQKKQKQTSFEEEVDAYLVEKYPLEYFEDASGKRQYNPESNRYRREGRAEAEKVVARRRAAEHITQLQKKPEMDPGVGKKWVMDYVEDKSQRRPLSMPEYFGKKYLGITPEGSESIPLKPVWHIESDPNEARLVAEQAAEAEALRKAAKSRKRRQRKKKKPKPLLGVEFDEQSFIWDHIQHFKNYEPLSQAAIAAQSDRRPLLGENYEANVHADEMLNQRSSYKYQNFIQLRNDDPATTNNKLWGYGADSLNDLTTAQLSALIPFIRIYKVMEGGDGKPKHIDFPFNKFTTMQSILDSKENRGTDAGLIGVDWDDTGQTPAESGLTFKGQIQLRFQSLEGIFKERIVDGEKISFGDLLYLKGALGSRSSKANTEKAKPELTPINPNQNCPEIVDSINMEIGWTIPDSPELNLDKNNLKDTLKLMRRTYTLTIFNQEIDITDNGDVGLRLDFTAGITGRTLSTMSDLLQIDVNNLDPNNPDNDDPISLKHSQQFQRRADVLVSQTQATNLRREKKHTRESVDKKKIQKRIDKLIEQQKEYQEEIKTLDSEISSIAFKRLITNLHVGTPDSTRIKYVDLTQDGINSYKSLLKLTADQYKESERLGQKVAYSRWTMIAARKSVIEEVEGSFNNELDNNFKFPNKSPSLISKKGESPQYAQAPTQQRFEGIYRIHYVFLGDIIEAAMDILYEPRTTTSDGTKGAKKSGKCPIVKEAIKIILGPFAFPDPWTGEIRSMELADIPVSLNYFNAWWYNKVVGKNRKNYFLRTFLSDLCRELLNNVISPERYGGRPGAAPRFQITPYTCPLSHPLNKTWKNHKNKPKKRMNLNDFMPGGRRQYTPGYQSKFSDWLYVYGTSANMSRTSHFDGNMEEDANIYLPHFFTGANKGIIKSIKFQKTKLPGMTEAMIARAYRNNDSKPVRSNLIFTSRYDCTVTLFGNPTYKPGMYIYIDPRSMGVGISSSFRDRVENDLGIGGYYLIYRVRHKISDGEYTTELQVKMHFGIREILGKREDSKKKKNKA